MSAENEIKLQLAALCNKYVDEKISTAEEAINSAQESANEETKSSSGDKYETGRSMMQLEIEKYSTQLTEGLKLKKALAQIDFKKTYQAVQPGALVLTNNGNFFISVSAGKLSLDDIDYMAISFSSPIGQALANKVEKDIIEFREKKYKILTIT
ncbi:MAG: 3-oxoacyl-ACP synthase [Ignavibacteriales bacterium]|nr:3-oxoacyl-ACP synthase [Ignavibacteriales bacterium]